MSDRRQAGSGRLRRDPPRAEIAAGGGAIVDADTRVTTTGDTRVTTDAQQRVTTGS